MVAMGGGVLYCVNLVDLVADCERSGVICTGSPIVTLAAKHDQPAVGRRPAGRLATRQLRGVIGTHSENTASGKHSGQGEKAGRHRGSVVSFPVLYHRIAGCLALPLVFHCDLQGRRCCGLRLRCDLANDRTEVSHQQLSASDLALTDCSIDRPHPHSLQT
jgi:hypothetical protein